MCSPGAPGREPLEFGVPREYEPHRGDTPWHACTLAPAQNCICHIKTIAISETYHPAPLSSLTSPFRRLLGAIAFSSCAPHNTEPTLPWDLQTAMFFLLFKGGYV